MEGAVGEEGGGEGEGEESVVRGGGVGGGGVVDREGGGGVCIYALQIILVLLTRSGNDLTFCIVTCLMGR